MSTRKRNVSRDKRIVELVKSGLTFGEVAKQMGITRNTVAGACHHAGVKARMDAKTAEKRRQINRRNVEKARVAHRIWLAGLSAEEKRERMQRMRARLPELWADPAFRERSAQAKRRSMLALMADPVRHARWQANKVAGMAAAKQRRASQQ